MNIWKKIWNALKTFYGTSNRWKHLIAGTCITLSMACLTLLDVPLSICFIAGFIAAFIAMCSVEYKDKSYGGKFDWGDVFAGISLPIIILIISVICYII